jgi:hypothetical protein
VGREQQRWEIHIEDLEKQIRELQCDIDQRRAVAVDDRSVRVTEVTSGRSAPVSTEIVSRQDIAEFQRLKAFERKCLNGRDAERIEERRVATARDAADLPRAYDLPTAHVRVWALKNSDRECDVRQHENIGGRRFNDGQVAEREDSDHDSAESTSSSVKRRSRPKRQFIKLDKFDGSGVWKSFIAKFRNCSEYSGWEEEDNLAHLQSCLSGPAEQLLWAEGGNRWNFEGLVQKLEQRYGSEGQHSLYRAELNARFKSKNETLLSYRQDIDRLVALSYDGPKCLMKDSVAVEQFLKGLDDHSISFKIRELGPSDLDEAFTHAKRLESYAAISRCYSKNK